MGACRARDAAPCNYTFEHERRRAELLGVAEELGHLKSAGFASVRHPEGEAGDQVLTPVEGDYGLVSVTEVVVCVRCVGLYLCVIPMSIIHIYDATDGRSRSECRRAAPRCTAKCS